jgi:hypothetical protein
MRLTFLYVSPHKPPDIVSYLFGARYYNISPWKTQSSERGDEEREK